MIQTQELELIWTRDLALFTQDLWWRRMIHQGIRTVWGVAPDHQINHWNGTAVELYRVHAEQEAFLEAMAEVPLDHPLFQPGLWEAAEQAVIELRRLLAEPLPTTVETRTAWVRQCFNRWVSLYPGFSWASHFPGIFLRERFLARHGTKIQLLIDEWYQRRTRVEGVFEEADARIRDLLQVVLKEVGSDPSFALVLRLDEVEPLLQHGRVPANHELEARRREYWLVNERLITTTPTSEVLTGYGWSLPKVEGDATAGIRGMVASRADEPIVGTVYQIMNREDVAAFPTGAILVSPMTWPNVVPAMKRAAAIVTDEGGLACHAAIVSRELGIPCVVGTKHATRLFKNGDTVEVDATKGFIRKIEG